MLELSQSHMALFLCIYLCLSARFRWKFASHLFRFAGSSLRNRSALLGSRFAFASLRSKLDPLPLPDQRSLRSAIVSFWFSLISYVAISVSLKIERSLSLRSALARTSLDLMLSIKGASSSTQERISFALLRGRRMWELIPKILVGR